MTRFIVIGRRTPIRVLPRIKIFGEALVLQFMTEWTNEVTTELGYGMDPGPFPVMVP